MINGQLDISGPLEAPWSLAKVMPDAELIVIGDEGHGGGAVDVRRDPSRRPTGSP